MASTSSHADKTSAADKSIGFDYQYYFFLLALLNLKVNQSAGLEVLDDVHTALNQEKNIFYQLKHTTQSSADGTPIALTKLDKDMWKTLYNWAMVITDVTSGRGGIAAQLDFVKRSDFHLVANKKRSSGNSVIDVIEELQNRQTNFEKAKEVIEGVEKSTTDDSLQKYIRTVLGLDDGVLECFLRQIQFELEIDDIIERVRNAIHEKHVPIEKVQTALEGIDSNLRELVFKKVKVGEHVVLSFDDFHKQFGKYIRDARSTKLTVKTFKQELPDDLFAQNFIKRLLEIKALKPDDAEYAAELTALKLQLVLHIEHWVQSGEVTSKDVAELHDAVELLWKSKFRLGFVECEDSEIEKIGRGLLAEMLSAKYELSEDELSLPHSNGEIYHLSDIGRIGWHKHWSEK